MDTQTMYLLFLCDKLAYNDVRATFEEEAEQEDNFSLFDRDVRELSI